MLLNIFKPIQVDSWDWNLQPELTGHPQHTVCVCVSLCVPVCVCVSPRVCVCHCVKSSMAARASWQIRAFRPVTFLQSPKCIMDRQCEKCWSARSTQPQMNGVLGALTRRWMEWSVLSAEVDREVTVSSTYLCVCVRACVYLLTLETSYSTNTHTAYEIYTFILNCYPCSPVKIRGCISTQPWKIFFPV